MVFYTSKKIFFLVSIPWSYNLYFNDYNHNIPSLCEQNFFVFWGTFHLVEPGLKLVTDPKFSCMHLGSSG